MSVESVNSIQTQQYPMMPPQMPAKEASLIELDEIKAILYLGLRGEVSLPTEDRKVDILA
ncbi:MAG: hypothetical protein JW760_11030 [Spirochaetales bacterium]|nr:hypothetical protein [Spirochaetales bacterium]